MILIVSMAVWTAGCREQETSDVQKCRLIAVENKELKSQIQTEAKKHDEEIRKLQLQIRNRDEEIKNLSAQLQAGVEREVANARDFKNQLDQCIKERNAVTQEEIAKQCEGTISTLTELIAELKTENDWLKAGQGSIKEKE